MPADLFRIDLDLIYPPFLIKALEVISSCRARGEQYYVTSGLRWFDEQARLRVLYLAGKGGKAAPAGLSAHNYGLAFDATHDSDLDMPGLQPDWQLPHYAALGEEAGRAGLSWGNAFNDSPHVGDPRFVSGAEIAPLCKIYTLAIGQPLDKLHAVWRHIDAIQEIH